MLQISLSVVTFTIGMSLAGTFGSYDLQTITRNVHSYLG